MRLFYNIKSLGKKKAYIQKKQFLIEVTPTVLLKDLLSEIVAFQVEEFNQRKDAQNLISFLGKNEIEKQVKSGSVRLSEQYDRQKAEVNKAVETVLIAFEDGLIAFFVNDEQYERLSDLVSLKDDDVLTFIRLTFLTGTFW